MTLHTPTLQHKLITCDACAYRAIITNRGLFVRDIGESPVDHQALLDAQKAQAERALRQLVRAYNERRPIFWDLYRLAWAEGREIAFSDLPARRDDGALDLRKARQLGQWIKAEFGV